MERISLDYTMRKKGHYIYDFLDEQALEKEKVKGYKRLMNAIVEKAIEDYKENNEFAMSAWSFLKEFFPKYKLPKPSIPKQSRMYDDLGVCLFEIK